MTRKRFDRKLTAHCPTILRLPRSSLCNCKVQRSLAEMSEAEESGDDEGD